MHICYNRNCEENECKNLAKQKKMSVGTRRKEAFLRKMWCSNSNLYCMNGMEE